MASGTKEDVFAALTDIENTEKIYLDNGVYKRNTTLRSSWDLRIVHEGDQQVSGHGERGASGVPADLSVFIPYFKNLCERNGYPFIFLHDNMVGSIEFTAFFQHIAPFPLLNRPPEILVVTSAVPGLDTDKRRLLSRRRP